MRLITNRTTHRAIGDISTPARWQRAAHGLAVLASVVLASVQTQAHASCVTDFSPPDITVTSPLRGAFIQSGSDLVTVQGVVSDTQNPIASIVINGEDVLGGPVGLVYSFAWDISTSWGLSTVTVSAVDACGNQADLSQSFIRSDSYYAAATAPDIAANSAAGIAVHLNQPGIDDDVRATDDDVASIADEIVSDIDVAALLNASAPTVLASDTSAASRGCSFPQTWSEDYYRVTRQNFSAAAAHVTSMSAEPQGLHTAVSIDSVTLPITAVVRQYTCTLGVGPVIAPNLTIPGTVTASGIVATGDVQLAVDDGQFIGSLDNPAVSVPSVSVSLDCGVLDFLCDLVTDNFIEPAVADAIDDALSDALNLVDGLAANIFNGYLPATAIDLPAPFSGSVNVTGQAEAVAVDGPAGAGVADFAIGVQVFPSQRGAAIPAAAPGAARHDGLPAGFDNSGYDIGFAVRDDVVNQLLWSAWYGGSFDQLDATALAGDAGPGLLNLTVSALLPPVVMPDSVPDHVRIALGDLAFAADIDLQAILGPPYSGVVTVSGYFSTTVAGLLGVNEARQTLRFDVSTTTATADVTTPGIPAAFVADIEQAIEAALAPLAGQLVSALVESLPLPTLDLHAIAASTFAAGETVALIGSQTDRPVETATRIVGFTLDDADSDADGVLDFGDNCILVANADQRDSNDDGYGNRCDADLNNDCVVNTEDLGILKVNFFGTFEDADFNGDGVVNAIDLGTMKAGFFQPPGPGLGSCL